MIRNNYICFEFFRLHKILTFKLLIFGSMILQMLTTTAYTDVIPIDLDWCGLET